MPWSIDGPSSRQLGYPRRERRVDDELAPPPTQQKRPWVGIALLVALPALVALLLVLYLTDRPPQIDGKAPGTWREVGTPEHYALVLRKTGEAGVYDIHYPRMGDTQRGPQGRQHPRPEALVRSGDSRHADVRSGERPADRDLERRDVQARARAVSPGVLAALQDLDAAGARSAGAA